MTDEMKIQVRFPPDVWMAVKQFAREDEQSFNAEVLWILKRYIQNRQGGFSVTTVDNQTWQDIQLRAWQELLTKKFQADWVTGKRRWLIEVTPGGGKTLWALLIARWLLDEKLIKRAVIICPSIHIRDQWLYHNKNEDSTDKFKPPILQLTTMTNDVLRNNEVFDSLMDFDGIVLTYAQLASGDGAKIQNDLCSIPGTLVIADEIHHVGRKRAFGQAYMRAFMNATAQIGLTGTPWTSEGAGPIPYVEYEEEGKDKGRVKNDGYKYTRTAAIQDDVLRPSQFYAFDAEVKLQDIDTCVATEVTQKLSDPDTEDSDMLDRCLYPYSNWMKSILREADNRLLDIIRGVDNEGEGIKDAKGLVTTKSIKFARMIQEQLEAITRLPVALIVSKDEDGKDNKDAKLELARFKEGKLGRWAVSVAMVSEGVDIRSLFVGIYATNVNSRKFWRQYVGRFERKRHPDERGPIIFFPATPTLMGLAKTMKDEVPQSLEEWDLPERNKSDSPSQEEKDYSSYQISEAELHSVIEDDKWSEPILPDTGKVNFPALKCR